MQIIVSLREARVVRKRFWTCVMLTLSGVVDAGKWCRKCCVRPNHPWNRGVTVRVRFPVFLILYMHARIYAFSRFAFIIMLLLVAMLPRGP